MIPASRSQSPMRWIGVSIILFSSLARVLTSPSRIPYWDIDPLTNWTPDTTRTPAMSLLFDALVWLAVSAIIWAEGRAGRSIAWKTGLLALIGCIGVALHGWALTPLIAIGGSPATHGDFQSMCLGSAWASAIIGAWALSMAARDDAIRRAAAATLLGVVIVLAAKGAMQVLIDHPRLVAQFNANKDAMLASQGFAPDSTNARLFERRLVQAEATGWFGLSNVYGSFMAAGTAAFLALAIAATRAARHSPPPVLPGEVAESSRPEGARRPNTHAQQFSEAKPRLPAGEIILLWLAFAAAAFGLALSGSKGAIAAGLLGCMVVIAIHWIGPPRETDAESSTRRLMRRSLRWSPIILPALALFAVIFRGLLGERLNELSLFFRWQYLLGATRIILAHPLFGTGPAGFKDQYLLFKEPTNPEEIESPHCLPIDWLATLGVFGLAWVALWIIWLWRSGHFLNEPRAQARGQTREPEIPPCWRAGLVVITVGIASSIAFSLWAEWATYVPESLAAITIAGALWWFASRSDLRIAAHSPESTRAAILVAAMVIATHSMIEVTGEFSSSCGLAMLILCLAAPSPSMPRSPRGAEHATVLILVLAAALVAGAALRIFRWESHLHQAAIHARQHAAQGSGWCDDTDSQGNAITHLHLAMGIEQRALDLPALSSRLRFLQSTCPGLTEQRRLQIIDAALTILRGTTERYPRSLAAHARRAAALELSPATSSEANPALTALERWKLAAQLHPSGLHPFIRMASLHASLGDWTSAAQDARRALQINQSLRLDPLKQLTEAERSEMERLAAPDPASPSPQAPTPSSPSTP